jgi:hypothetical protein
LVDEPVHETPTTTPISQAETKSPCRSSRTSKKIKSYAPSIRGKLYNYSATQLEQSKFEYDPRVIKMIFTQLSLKAAIKAWGKDATNAAKAEMKQLHWQNSFMPKLWSELSPEQKEKVLESHIFITQKRTGEIKGRTVAGGNK